MKKICALLICIISVCMFSACNNIGTLEDNVKQSEALEKTISNNIDLSKSIQPKCLGAERYTESSLSLTTGPIKNIQEMINSTPVIVWGNVNRTEYLLNGSEVYTMSEVAILECFKGGLKENDVIRIREIGGFVPCTEFDDALSLEKYGKKTSSSAENGARYDIRVKDYKVMEPGEQVLLFLYPIKYSSFSEFQTNSYETTRVWQGKLLLDEEKGLFYPYIPKEELEYIDAESFILSVSDFRSIL